MCAAFDVGWETAYRFLVAEGLAMYDLLNSNAVWGAYLRRHGFVKRNLPDSCVDGYTVADFTRDNPRGMYVLALPNHVVCVRDGELWDSWNSSNEVVLYYFERLYS